MKIIRALLNTFKSIIRSVSRFVVSNLYYLSTLMTVGVSYLMYWLCMRLYTERGYFAVGSELLIPLIVYFIILFIDNLGAEFNEGKLMPIPKERFTKVNKKGAVSVDEERLLEMLLYMGELENYLEREGKL